MKTKRIIALSLLCLGILTSLTAKGEYTFRNESKLATGKWIKVEIESTGLYQIPYSTLREMGFENPAEVGVYGKGGGLLSVNFTSAKEGIPYTDDIDKIAVIHENGSLYFYGKGVEDIQFEAKSAPLFKRGTPNLYSNTAYYFLSDIDTPLLAAESQYDGNGSLLNSGWGYIYHEADLEQNSTGTGQLFWGESFLGGKSTQSWTFPSPWLVTGTGRLMCRLYTSPGSSVSGNIEISNADQPVSINRAQGNNDVFYNCPLTLPLTYNLQESDNMTLSITATGSDPDFLNLDYWLLSYQKKIPDESDLKGKAAEQYSFSLTADQSYSCQLGSGLRFLDVTDPGAIKRGKHNESNPMITGFTASATSTSAIIYDPNVKQLEIKSWERVENKNLHALKEEGAELLIITVPRFRSFAERIAGLHRDYENIKVAVATPEEVYNEFSSGTPDPMAYRAIARMLYDSKGSRLKNILLLGPSDRNLRREIEGETKFDRIIGLQQATVTPGRAASPGYDFYGIIIDEIDEERLYTNVMNVGVGLLSCETDNECERAIRKIEEYLSDDTQAWRVNETLTVGGLHDNHTHDKQAEDYGNLIRNYTGISGMAHTTIAVDAYGNKDAQRMFSQTLENGKIFSVWFGHGGRAMLGQDKNFFTTSEAVSLKNSHLGFMYMGGCDFSLPDIRARGLGETIVLDSERGMAGAIVSTRTAWSNQNYDLGKRILDGWLKPANTDVSPTIGEVYAKAKSNASSANSLTFVLAGDPALKIPSPLRMVKMSDFSASPGEKIIIDGSITDKNGNPDNSFNGKVVFKLMEPAITLRSKDYVTHTGTTPVKVTTNGETTTVYYTLDVTYDTNLITAAEADVESGKFSVSMVIPKETAAFTDQNLKLHAGVFDKSRWLGGSGAATISITSAPSENTQIDIVAPVVNATYDNNRQIVIVEASDETSLPLSPSAYTVTLDGRPSSMMTETYDEDGNSGKTFSGYTDIYDLADGKHTYSVTARDIAGNNVTTEIEFVKEPRKAPLSLILSSKAVVDDIEICVEGDDNPGSLEYEIRNTNGETVMTRIGAFTSITWDCRDSKGNKVSPGLYRIRVRSAEGSVSTKYSEWANFAILQ